MKFSNPILRSVVVVNLMTNHFVTEREKIQEKREVKIEKRREKIREKNEKIEK